MATLSIPRLTLARLDKILPKYPLSISKILETSSVMTPCADGHRDIVRKVLVVVVVLVVRVGGWYDGIEGGWM